MFFRASHRPWALAKGCPLLGEKPTRMPSILPEFSGQR